MTITVRGTRAQVERTFEVGLAEYQISGKSFYANDRDPHYQSKSLPRWTLWVACPASQSRTREEL